MNRNHRVDRLFLAIVGVLLIVGFFFFFSATLGSLARGSAIFNNLILGQITFGFLGGGICMFIASRIKYTFWRKHALAILLVTIVLAILVFVPGIGVEHGGAKRWIDLRI